MSSSCNVSGRELAVLSAGRPAGDPSRVTLGSVLVVVIVALRQWLLHRELSYPLGRSTRADAFARHSARPAAASRRATARTSGHCAESSVKAAVA
jgi:hypothetical protein